MSLFPDITPLVNKINEFTTNQKQTQAQIIALLTHISQQLTHIQTLLNQPNYA